MQVGAKTYKVKEEERKESDLHPLGRWCIAEVDTGLPQITESHCRDWHILTEEQRKTNFSRVNGHQLQQPPAKAKTHPETEEEGQVTGDKRK